MDNIKCFNGEQIHGRNFAHVQDGVNPRILSIYVKNVSSSICGQRKPRSACAFAQSDQVFRCPQTDFLDTIECYNESKCPDETAHVHIRMHFFA